jgi:hypothetical protein
LRAEDPRHRYASPSSGQETANRQYTEGGPRGIGGPSTNRDFRGSTAHLDRPLMGHEIGQWTFFPNFAEQAKYTGVLQARNFDVVRASMTAHGIVDLAPKFVAATGHQAVLCYKEEIEVLRRTPNYAGFSLLDLHDYPGQGTALIGLLDPFWDSKGFIAPAVHRQYDGPVAPLLRLSKRVFTSDETLEGDVDLSQFGPADLPAATAVWTVRDEQGAEIAAGRLPAVAAPTGTLTTLGHISTSLAKAAAPCKLTVEVAIAGTPFLNSWDIWVYPSTVATDPPAGVVVASQWDEAAKAALADGKRVVLLPEHPLFAGSLPGAFLPTFWSPVWFPSQKPDTMGILVDPHHPLFANFPTEYYANWQWWDLLQNSRTLNLDATPAAFRPIVEVIDNYARNGKLGNLFEAKVGPGRLLVCALDLRRDLAHRPAARQLLAGLWQYVGSEAFNPAQELDAAVLDKLLAAPIVGTMAKLGAKIVHTDSEVAGYEAAHVLDGDTETIWHTQWEPQPKPYPHELVIRFAQRVTMSGFKLLPRQDIANGQIRSWEMYVSDDGQTWGEAVAKGRFPEGQDVHEVHFNAPVTGQFLRFVGIDGQRDPFCAVAELEVLP